MIAEELKAEMLTHALYRLHYTAAVTEYGGHGCEGIADVFGVTKRGYTHEFEVKVAKSDLAGELASIRYLTTPRTLLDATPEEPKMSKGLKHRIYLGRTDAGSVWRQIGNIPNYFSFLVPAELEGYAMAGIVDSPYGLYVFKNGDVMALRTARKIHTDKASPEITINILHKACSEVETLRRQMAEGRRCTQCFKALPKRCYDCARAMRA